MGAAESVPAGAGDMSDAVSTTEVDPLAEPTARVSKKFITILALANLGIWTAFFAPINFLLPLQVEAIVGSGTKETNLGLVLAIGALVSLVSSPISGALSDRTSSRLGRRRSWVLWPSIAAFGVLLVLGNLTTIGGLVIGWALAQLTLNASYAAVTAMLPDQVPVEQRGTVSALVGAGQPVGIILGGVISIVVAGDNNAGNGQNVRYIVVGVIVLLTAALFVFGMKDPQLAKDRIPKMQWGAFFKGFWISPKEHPDFAWVWFTRFLVILGTAFVTSYLLYFSRDVLGKSAEEAPKTVTSILVLYVLALLVSVLAVGPLSDRTGKVKPFVIGASAVAALAMVILAFAHNELMAIIAAVIMGLGFGAYTAVDLALISRVLPNAEDRARDLGVMNIANAGPQVIAPFVAGWIISLLKVNGYSFAYAALYLTAGAITLVGAVLVTKVRSVP